MSKSEKKTQKSASGGQSLTDTKNRYPKESYNLPKLENFDKIADYYVTLGFLGYF